MTVLVVAAGINPASGGPTRSCKGLCRALSQADVDATRWSAIARKFVQGYKGVLK